MLQDVRRARNEVETCSIKISKESDVARCVRMITSVRCGAGEDPSGPVPGDCLGWLS